MKQETNRGSMSCKVTTVVSTLSILLLFILVAATKDSNVKAVSIFFGSFFLGTLFLTAWSNIEYSDTFHKISAEALELCKKMGETNRELLAKLYPSKDLSSLSTALENEEIVEDHVIP